MLNIFSCSGWSFVYLRKKGLFSFSAHFQSDFIVFFFFSCWVVWLLYICCILTTYQIYDFLTIISHFIGSLFILLMVFHLKFPEFSFFMSYLTGMLFNFQILRAFSDIFLLLDSSVILFICEILYMISIFFILLKHFHGPEYNLSWWLFHVHFKKKLYSVGVGGLFVNVKLVFSVE